MWEFPKIGDPSVLNSGIHIIRTQKMVPLILGNPHVFGLDQEPVRKPVRSNLDKPQFNESLNPKAFLPKPSTPQTPSSKPKPT